MSADASAARMLALGLVLALALPGCRFGETASEPEGPELPPTARVQRGRFVVAVHEVGVLRARTSRGFSAPRWGKIERLVDEGTEVVEGDPVLWLERKDLERRLLQREADVVQAKSKLDKQVENIALQRKRIALDLAKTEATETFRRQQFDAKRKEAEDAERRLSAGLITERAAQAAQRAFVHAQYEHRHADLQFRQQAEQAKAEERQLETQRRQAERSYHHRVRRRDSTKRRLESSTLVAPSPGMVFLPKVDIGGEQRSVRVGDQVGTWMGAIVELPDLTTLEVRSQIDEALLMKVAKGLPVRVTVAAAGDVELEGRVRVVEKLAVPRSKSEGAGFSENRDKADQQVVFPVAAELTKLDPRLQPGMTVAISFVLDTVEDALTVPAEAVFGSGGEALVFVATLSGWEERRVALGQASDDRVVVREGLREGESVYLGDPRTLQARVAVGRPRAES